MSASQFLEARNAVTTKLYADPHNPHIHLERGLIYEKLGFPDLAAADAYRALSLLESVIDPDGFEFHAKKKIDPSAPAPEKTDESDDEDEDEDTIPVTEEEYDALIDQVYVLLVRSLVRCGCYRDAFEFGVRGLGLLREKKSAAASVITLTEQMDRIKQIYQSRTGSDTDLESIDPSVLPAQGFAHRVLYP